MIAAAIVCAAAFSNAAALSWTSYGYINDGSADSDWITGGQAYLIQITDAATFAVADDLTVTGGKIVDSVGIAGGYGIGTWNGTDSLVDGNKYNFAVLFTTDGTGMDSMPTTGFYGVDNNGDTGNDFYEITWNASTGVAFAANDASFAGASMSTAVAAVPEPTSGLLLLLGMAGLALRRKQA